MMLLMVTLLWTTNVNWRRTITKQHLNQCVNETYSVYRRIGATIESLASQMHLITDPLFCNDLAGDCRADGVPPCRRNGQTPAAGDPLQVRLHGGPRIGGCE